MNIDKTGCFLRALPDKGFGQKTKDKRGKQSKNRVTVALVVNASVNFSKNKLHYVSCHPSFGLAEILNW